MRLTLKKDQGIVKVSRAILQISLKEMGKNFPGTFPRDGQISTKAGVNAREEASMLRDVEYVVLVCSILY